MPAASVAPEAGGRAGIEDSVGVNAVDSVEIGNVTRLSEPVDAERVDAMARDRAEPRQRRRMRILHRDECGARRKSR